MELLTLISDRLLRWLLIVGTILIGGIDFILWWCPRNGCQASDVLQVWIDFWGFSLAILTALVAWAEARRGPRIQIDLFEVHHSEQDPEYLRYTEPGEFRFEISIANFSSKPAHSPNLHVKLVADQSSVGEEDNGNDPFEVVKLTRLHTFDIFADCEPVRTKSETSQSIWINGGNKVTVYGHTSPSVVLSFDLKVSRIPSLKFNGLPVLVPESDLIRLLRTANFFFYLYVTLRTDEGTFHGERALISVMLTE